MLSGEWQYKPSSEGNWTALALADALNETSLTSAAISFVDAVNNGVTGSCDSANYTEAKALLPDVWLRFWPNSKYVQ